MRAAIFQFSPVFGDAATNVARIEHAVRSAEAELWVLPELATTGYLFSDRAECGSLAEPVSGPSLHALADLCRERRTRLVVGFAERDGDMLFNSSAYVGPDGLVAVYRKVHLFDRELLTFDPGPDPFRVAALGPHHLGMMICFDWVFPEAARSLALLGADVIAHPSNLVLPYCQDAMVTRALENGVFCLTANRVGVERRAGVELAFTGCSRIVDPRGRVLAQAPAADDATLLADLDLDLARDKSLTPRNDRLGDRRPECYVGRRPGNARPGGPM
ncbi:MAG: acyltransferase [Deltaproteobacteria bacterium]|nr:acyltransferase [Deltaproteobacteria bacterium]